MYYNRSQKGATGLTHERGNRQKVATFDFSTIFESNQSITRDRVNLVQIEIDIRNQHEKINLPANFELIR